MNVFLYVNVLILFKMITNFAIHYYIIVVGDILESDTNALTLTA